MTSIKNVVIIGAAGNLGSAVLAEFLKSDLNITVLSRPDSQSTFPSGVNVIRPTYDPQSLEAAFKGQDAVISMVGNAGFGEQPRFIDAAIAAGVKWFIPSEFGSNTADEANRKMVPIFNGKRKVVEYLQSKDKEGLSWTVVVTGLFFDWGLPRGSTGFDFNTKTVQLWDGGNTPFSVTNLPTIGKALVGLFSNPSALEHSKNKYVYIASHTITQRELLSVIEKVTGEKWKVEEVNGHETIEKASKALQGGDFSAILPLIKGVNFGGDHLNDYTSVPGGLSNEVLLPGVHEDLEQDVRKALSE